MSDRAIGRWRDLYGRGVRDLVAGGLRLRTVSVDGVEVTQTIQHYDAAAHLSDPADRGADNSIRLIASKPAWVRVYVRSLWSEQVAGVTGTLVVERRHAGFLWSEVATLDSQPPGSITARRAPDYTTERSTLTDTLNFIIPAATFYGMLRVTARLTDSDGFEYDTDTLIVDATLRQTLRVRGIMVSYNGPSTAAMPPPGGTPVVTVTLAAPTLADLQATAALSLRAMPVQSQGEFTSAGTVAWNMPLDDPRSCPGCCSPNWDSLLTTLGNQRTNDGNRTDLVYYGLLPAGIPLGVPGCGSGGLGSAAAGNQPTLMHEIGHGYGFSHTPCGAGGTPDPNYPTYEPYPAASIGEFGLDVADGTIFPPASTFDYMSYCGPRWMSLYQHDRLLFHDRIGQEWLRDDLPWERYVRWREYMVWKDLPYPPPDPYRWDEMRFDPIIAISGVVQGPGMVDVRSVARVAAAGRPPGVRTTLTARLVDQDGVTLARGTVRRLNAQAGGCSCGGHHHDDDDDREDVASYAFEVYVPDVGPGAALVIDEGEEVVWERRAPSAPPRVGKLDADVTDDGRLVLRWDAATEQSGDERERPTDEVWVQWSSDDGVTWRGLATGIRGSEAAIDLGPMGTGSALVRVLVHDGFSTVTSDPVRVQVPERAPEVAILHPEDNGLLVAGGTMRVWAAVNDAAGTPLDDVWCRWVLDGREVGQGLDEWLVAPEPGEHRLTVLVRTKVGETERSVRFSCVPGAPSQAPLRRRG